MTTSNIPASSSSLSSSSSSIAATLATAAAPTTTITTTLSSSTTPYLYNYLESLEYLPLDLLRNCNLMRELDSRAEKILLNVNKMSNSVLTAIINDEDLICVINTQTQLTTATPADIGKEGFDYWTKEKVIKKIQKLYATAHELSEDKLQLANQSYELVDKYIRRLDVNMTKLKKDVEHVYRSRNEPLTDELLELGIGAHDAQNLQQILANTAAAAAISTNISTTIGTSTTSTHNVSIIDTLQQQKTLQSAKQQKRKRKGSISSKSNSKNSNTNSHNNNNNNNNNNTNNSNTTNNITTNKNSGKENISASNLTKPKLTNSSANNLISSVVGSCSPLLDEFQMAIDPNEPTYCICCQVSYGEMIACDNPNCPIEWFHFGCVGLVNKPRGKWFCTDCA